jgi:hypothetical protein
MLRSPIARSFALLTLGVALTPLLTAAPDGRAPVDQPALATPDQADALTKLSPEVRLRKLHLVRPDLIPYPIALEVYC